MCDSIAWMESYLTFSNFFSALDMTLFETDEETTDWTDCGNSMIKQHVKVKINAIAPQ